MRISSPSALALCATAFAMLAGCSGGASQSSGATAPLASLSQSARIASTGTALRGTTLDPLPPGMRLAGTGSTHRSPFVNVAGVNAPLGNQVIIADAFSATVTVWGGAGQLNAILFDGISANPQGMTTDAAGNLYVANIGFGNVVVYPKPYTAIATTLADAGEEPEDVAVSQTGVVAVTNYLTTSLSPGSVSFYAKGSTTACALVNDPNWITYYNAAFDASGNLFIDGQNRSGSTLVGEIAGGCAATSITTLTVGNTIGLPGAVQIEHGAIFIGDPANRAVYTYAHPSGSSLGSPTASTTLAGSTYPLTFAMMDGGQNLWSADYNATLGFAGKYGYPGGAFRRSITEHLLPIGIAVNPPALP